MQEFRRLVRLHAEPNGTKLIIQFSDLIGLSPCPQIYAAELILLPHTRGRYESF